MRDVAEWIRGTLASRRAAKQRAAAILFVGSTTELSPGAALLASEPDLPRLPFAGQKAGPRINGDAVHNSYPPRPAGILDSAVGDITPYTQPLQQARLRLEELATEARRGDFRAVGRVSAASAGIKQGSESTVRLPRETLKTTSGSASR